MAKFSLDIEYDYDFLLIGISCHEKDYRLCWAMNKELNIELEKQPDLEIKEKKQVESSGHSLYIFPDEENYIEYSVVANRATGGLLVPEQKQADYLLKVTGTLTTEKKESILSAVRSIGIVLMAYDINPSSLKSKQSLQF